MRPRRKKPTVFAISKILWFFALSLVCTPVSAEKVSSSIVCRDDLSPSRRAELTRKLQNITGWPDLRFDENGFLRIGTREAVGGSKTARALLRTALYGPNLVILEDASKRSDVVFCRVIPGEWKSNRGSRPPAYIVLIDFLDFEQLMGDTLALNAFNVGWGLLHELDHVANDSSDSATPGNPGDCEAHINLMRRECGLPERADYYFTLFPLKGNDAFMTRFVRLAFDHQALANNKKKRYWLIWDASLVGGLNEPQEVASLR